MKEKFEELKTKYPNHSSLILFGRFIRMTTGERWTRRKITKYFNLMVDGSDYLGGEKRLIIQWLCEQYTHQE